VSYQKEQLGMWMVAPPLLASSEGHLEQYLGSGMRQAALRAFFAFSLQSAAVKNWRDTFRRNQDNQPS